MRAADAFYNPDYRLDRISLSNPSAKRSLERLRAYKDGVYLPYLSEIYNKLVFNDMVLPDHKMEKIYHALSGEDLSD